MKQLLRRLSELIRKFTGTAFGTADTQKRLSLIQWQLGQLLLQSIWDQPRNQDPLRVTRSGFKVFSQNDEDGIIEEIFARIGSESRFFIEIGAGNGWENNTCALLYKGWRGVWIDASPENLGVIRRTFVHRLSSGQVELIEHFVTREFTQKLTERWPDLAQVDLFSLDIDGNDYHILDAFDRIRARVVVVEYNGKFRPPIDWVMPYEPQRSWDGTDYYGASLSAWCRLLQQKGYVLVGCNLTGVNAFFVREDLARGKFCEPFTAENHYEPPRWLGFRSQHRTQG